MQQVDYEQAVLGMLLYGINQVTQPQDLAQYTDQLSVEDFATKSHKLAFEHIKRMVDSNQAFDLISTTDYIEKSDNWQDGSTFSYYGEITRNTASTISLPSHIKQIKTYSMRTRAMQLLEAQYNKLLKSDDPLSDLTKAESAISKLITNTANNTTDTRHISDVGANYIEQVIEQYENPESSIGIATGFDGLDKILGRRLMRRGSLMMIGGRPAMGKTALMLKIMMHNGLESSGQAVLAFSMEMPDVQLFERMVNDKMKLSDYDFEHNFNDACDRLVSFQAQSARANIYINDKPNQTIETIKSSARKLAKTHKISLICVDYLTIMKMPSADRHDLAVSEITREMKYLARELDCVVVMLAQLNRKLEERKNKRPMQSDLRDSGGIEQDADYVLFPYRDSVYSEDSYAGDYAELILVKNRHGMTGTAYAQFKGGAYHDCNQEDAQVKCDQSKINERPNEKASRL